MNGRKSNLFSIFGSAIGKKILTGITGIGLALFVLVHMLGNLSYFSSDPDAYNRYSHTLMSLGPLLWLIEIGLLIFFIVHVAIGIRIYIGKRRARPVGYTRYQSAGGASRQSLSSRSMVLTGLILLVFTIVHLKTFKFGPGIDMGYVATVDGQQIRDLKRLLVEVFQSPIYTFVYVLVMLLLGFHLRHGVWSALQSLGAMNPRLTPVVYTLGGLIGLGIAVGFLVLPLWIFFGG